MRAFQAAGMAAVACAGLVLAGPARAQQTNEDAIVKLAMTRARLEVALRSAAAQFDERRSGWAGTWELVDELGERVKGEFDKAVAREEAKLEDVRDQKFLEFCAHYRETKEQDWHAAERKRGDLASRYEDCTKTFGHLNEIFEGLGDIEKRWKDAGLDVGVLEPAYAAIRNRLDAAQEQARQVLAAQAAAHKEWEAVLKEVQTKLAPQQ